MEKVGRIYLVYDNCVGNFFIYLLYLKSNLNKALES